MFNPFLACQDFQLVNYQLKFYRFIKEVDYFGIKLRNIFSTLRNRLKFCFYQKLFKFYQEHNYYKIIFLHRKKMSNQFA